jgi:hypothetical protein
MLCRYFYSPQCGEVNVTDIARKNKAIKKSGGDAPDLKTGNGNVFQAGPDDRELTEKERTRMRRAAERKAIAQLSAAAKQILLSARGFLGQDTRQQQRISRGTVSLLTPQEEEDGGGEDSAAGEERAATKRKWLLLRRNRRGCGKSGGRSSWRPSCARPYSATRACRMISSRGSFERC